MVCRHHVRLQVHALTTTPPDSPLACRYAESRDWIYICIGLIGAIVNGREWIIS